MNEAAEGPGGTPWGIGVFGFPEGLLLLGDDPSSRAARTSLAAGRLPGWADQPPHPDSPEAPVAAAYAGDVAGALRVLQGRDDAVSAYNRWVLDPSSATPGEVYDALPPELAPLVEVVGWTVGLTDPPTPRRRAAPEVAALVLAALASRELERGDASTAVTLLDGAVLAARPAASVLAAVLQGNAAGLRHSAGHPDRERTRTELARAAEALRGTDLVEARAELLHELGLVSHEQAASDEDGSAALLQSAVRCYYEALQLVSEEEQPLLWAGLQLDLSAAHLSMPMQRASDQLRLGVAAQSLRAARRVFAAQDQQAGWATATINLANALVYTPSTHQADNLLEAVGLYREVDEAGARDQDPVGRARLLANLGNALAHLGVFDEARPALAEARYLFEQALDHDGVLTVRAVQDEIARTEVADPDEELADLARATEQMARMPVPDGPATSGMGVRLDLPWDALPPPRATVTVLDKEDRPT